MQYATRSARFAIVFVLLLSLIGSTNTLAQSASCSTATGCAFVMLNGIVGGLGNKVSGALWGWVFGGGSATDNSGIVDELDTIETTLKNIEGELVQIEKDIEQLNCGLDFGALNQYASGIQTYFQMYQSWVKDMQNNGAMPDPGDLSEWANCVVGLPKSGQSCAVSGNVSVQTMLQGFSNAATSTAGSEGSIGACVKASSTLPEENSLDDRLFYSTYVEPITQWYLGVNAQGMAVLAEAWHYRAWQDAGSPTVDDPDDIYEAICPAGAKSTNCYDPINYYNDVFFENVKSQMLAGGAPYSTDEYLMLNGSGNSYLLARSIEAYEKALDPDNTAGCATSAPGSRDSETPCGKTVGYYDDPFPSVSFGPYGYGGTDAKGDSYGNWVSSVAPNFQVMLDQFGFNTLPFSGVTLSRQLCTLSSSDGDTTNCLQANGGAGLQVGNKIIQFSDLETSAPWVLAHIGHPLIRFADGALKNTTSTQPFMNAAYEEIFINYGESCGPTEYINYRSSGTNQSKDPDYYIFSICYDPYKDLTQFLDWTHIPNFDPRNPVRQYRWPALDWTALTCSDGSSASKAFIAAGMPTMCGADFEAWFETFVPPGPSTTTISATADTTLSSAAPNSNDGAGWYLSLSANPPRGNHRRALLGFDPDALQAALAAGEVQAVFLTLTPEALVSSESDLSQAWQATGANAIHVVAHPFLGDFVEGDGDLAGSVPSSGTGSTWYCAEEADPTDNLRDCLQRWPSPLVNRRDGVVARQEWNRDSA